jgi:hypothetical protein
VLVPNKDKCDGIKDNLRDLSLSVPFVLHENFVRISGRGRGYIFKTTIGNECVHETSNNRVRAVNFSTSKKELLSRVQCSHIAKFINTLGLLMERHNQIDHVLVDC